MERERQKTNTRPKAKPLLQRLLNPRLVLQRSPSEPSSSSSFGKHGQKLWYSFSILRYKDQHSSIACNLLQM